MLIPYNGSRHFFRLQAIRGQSDNRIPFQRSRTTGYFNWRLSCPRIVKDRCCALRSSVEKLAKTLLALRQLGIGFRGQAVASLYNPFVRQQFCERTVELVCTREIRFMTSLGQKETAELVDLLGTRITTLQHLEFVAFEGAFITDTHLQGLATLPCLKRLSIIDTSISVCGLDHILDLKNLEYLAIVNLGTNLYCLGSEFKWNRRG